MKAIGFGNWALWIGLCLPATAGAQISELVKWTKNAVGNSSDERTIALFRIRGPLAEIPTELPPLLGNEAPLSLLDLLERFKLARLDPEVVAVVVDLQEAELGLGQLEEIHEALQKFAAVDKEVYVHADSLHTGTYAAATAASHLSVVPTGDVWLTGIYSETPYIRGALEKIGITPDMEQCGDFKTGAEIITRKAPSEQSEQMTKWLLDGVYGALVERMAKGRRLSVAKMQELIDNGPYSAEEALKAGLIDSIKHRRDFVEDLKKRHGDSVNIVSDYGEDEGDEIPEDFFSMVNWLMQMMNPSPKEYTEPSVALVFVEGMIVTGSSPPASPFGQSSGAYSTTIRKALDRAAEDESVKAVVLRVDSPGGSALASEIIWNATMRVLAKKPLIVSMGNVAGSGGYYVSCGAETIFADRSTITSSIGVLGGKFVTTGGWDKLGIHWHAVQRGQMAGILNSSAPFNDKERAKIRHYMDTVYDVFKKHVVEGRKGKLTKPIDQIAGGRVFTGAQALELGLIDQIGGLDDAVKFAASRAGLSDYELRIIPEPPTIFDLFMQHDPDQETTQLAVSIGSWVQDPVAEAMIAAVAKIDPPRARAVAELLRGLELIGREKAAVFMPRPFLFR
jgi:protease-4